jgi:hypothetical protein
VAGEVCDTECSDVTMEVEGPATLPGMAAEETEMVEAKTVTMEVGW